MPQSFVPAVHSTHEWTGNPYGRVLHFGIREHAMAAIVNGIVLHGNTRAFGGTFLIFSDYMRPAVRLAALMKAPVDLRLDARLRRARRGRPDPPADRAARGAPRHPGPRRRAPGRRERGRLGLEDHPRAPRTDPAGIALTRQNIPVFARGDGEASGDTFASADERRQGRVRARRGSRTARPDVIFIATGSEVQIAVDAREQLKAEGINARVVSVPCLEWFEEQDAAVPRVGAACRRHGAGLDRGRRRPRAGSEYVGDAGRSVSIEHFGASADYKTLFREFGMTTRAAVVAAAKESLASA